METGTTLAGAHANVGLGPHFDLLDIGHPEYLAVLEADTAFWTLVPRREAADFLVSAKLAQTYQAHQERFQQEMTALRFGLIPSAVYFNPTERCNLNCRYCYLPEAMRRSGVDMSPADLERALKLLAAHFAATLPAGAVKPQLVFHGSEPMLQREAIFAAIERFGDRFRFGIQTNGTLLDDEAVAFIRRRGVSLGLSLDAHLREINDQSRYTWGRQGVFGPVSRALELLAGYENFSVICTVSQTNVAHLPEIVDYFHQHQVPVALFNPVRCTQPGGRALKPADEVLAASFIAALDRTYELFQATGRRLVVANFANILLAIVAPTARRLMCDISPCGGGRCFFAVAATGDVFPCSEFIGLPEFRGGNLFQDDLEAILASEAFRRITGRKVEDFQPCARCAIRHYCGAPCPAEVYTTYGTLAHEAPYCGFYIAQVRYAFRILAEDRLAAYLWEGWDQGVTPSFAW